MPTKRGRGRPPFKPTPKLRKRVSICAGGGMSQEQIAIALGIDRDTLRKHFGPELSTVAMQRRAAVLEAVFEKGLQGNVSAAKVFIQNAPEFEPPPEKPERSEAKPERLGKKEQANVDATTAQRGTDWADLLPTARPQ
jgi:hypothetical protein